MNSVLGKTVQTKTKWLWTYPSSMWADEDNFCGGISGTASRYSGCLIIQVQFSILGTRQLTSRWSQWFSPITRHQAWTTPRLTSAVAIWNKHTNFNSLSSELKMCNSIPSLHLFHIDILQVMCDTGAKMPTNRKTKKTIKCACAMHVDHCCDLFRGFCQ